MERQTSGQSRKSLMLILAIVGIVLVIVGVAIATVPGTHLRGSGLGTISIVGGLVLLVVSFIVPRLGAQSLPPPPPPA